MRGCVLGARGRGDDPVQLTVRGLDAGADVEPAAPALLTRGGDERGHRVGDVDVVPGVAAVAEHRGRLATQQRRREDRHDAGLPAGVLPGTVDVGHRQGRAVHLVQPAVGAQVVLAGDLARRVGGLRVQRRLLGGGQVLRGAVDGAAGRREHDLAHARVPRGLGDVDGAHHVLVRVGQRVGHADPDVDLRGQVEDHLGRGVGDDVAQVGRGDVDLVQRQASGGRRGGQVLPPPAAQVVGDVHVVAVGQQPVDQGGADEPGSAGDECPHAVPFAVDSCDARPRSARGRRGRPMGGRRNRTPWSVRPGRHGTGDR